MSWLQWTLIATLFVVTSTTIVVSPLSRAASDIVAHGVLFWRRWLPAMAVLIYIVILAANLSFGVNAIKSQFDLGSTLAYPETLVLFLVGPLLFTSAGPVIAFATTIFLLGRFLALGALIDSPHTTTHALLGASVTIVAILGRHAPWMPNARDRFTDTGLKTAYLLMGLAAVGVAFAALIRVNSFHAWMTATTGVALPVEILLALMALVFAGWVLTLTDVTRQIFLLALAPPTLLAAAYLTHWTLDLLAIPFAACLAFALLDTKARVRANRWRVH